MGSILSASPRASRHDEFFYDSHCQQWRWHWEGRWWTFQPLFDDDMDFGGVLRKGGWLVSDQGHAWHGPDPEEWSRRHRRRQALRRWRREEVARCSCASLSMRRKALPAPLADFVVELAFGDDIARDALNRA